MSTEGTAVEAMAPGAATTTNDDAGEDVACYRLRCNETTPESFVRLRRKHVTHTLLVLVNCLDSLGPDETAAFGIHILQLLQLPPLEFNLILVGTDGTCKQDFISHWSLKSENVEGVSLRPRTVVHPRLSNKTVNNLPVAFQTNRGPIIFNCYDDPFAPTDFQLFRHLTHHVGSQCAIVMFGLGSSFFHGTYINVCSWFHNVKHVFPDIPVVLVGNDVEGRTANRLIRRNVSTLAEKKGADYVEISTHSNCDLEKPFLALARKLSGDRSLRFVKSTAATSSLSP